MKTLSLLLAALLLLSPFKTALADDNDNDAGQGYQDPATVTSNQPAPVPTPVIHLTGVVDDDAETLIAQQLKEINETTDATHAILVINSPGGSVISMLRIIQDLEESKTPIVCLDAGLAAS